MSGYDRKKIIVPLQGLRGIAFLSIFVSHCGIRSLNGLGAWGVSVFFIMSGFLMMANYYNKNRLSDFSLVSNLKFSLSKIKPLYALHIIMMICALSLELVRSNLTHFGNLFFKVITNITLTQSYVPNADIYFSLNAVSWYLSAIFFCYICFPWILKFFEHYIDECKAVIAVFFLFFLQWIISWLVGISSDSYISDDLCKWLLYIAPPIRLIDYLFGCFAGYIFLTRKDFNSTIICENHYNAQQGILWLIVSIGLITVMIFHSQSLLGNMKNKEIWWSFAAAYSIFNTLLIYLLGMVSNQNCICKFMKNVFLVRLGDISSELFLIHQIVIRCLRAIYKRLPFIYSPILFIIFSLLISIICAQIWNYIIVKRSEMKWI